MTQDIDEASSKRICSHMNEDHASTAHGIVTRYLEPHAPTSEIGNARLKLVSLQGMTVSYVRCTGVVCRMETKFVPFDPPLTAAALVRPRMIEIHNRVCAPKVSWIVTDPVAAGLVMVCSLIAFAVLIVGVDNLAELIDASPTFQPVVTTLFGSATFFGTLLTGSLYFTVVAHTAEAIWVAYECKRTLKLQLKPTVLWFLLVCLTGYPITMEFVLLRKVHIEAKTAKKYS